MSIFSIFQNQNKSSLEKEQKIIQIGIDFGTSMTKVCYRFDDRSYLLEFDKIKE